MLPPGYTLRETQAGDYDSFVRTLRVLTTVGNVTALQFAQQLGVWALHPDIYFSRVILNAENNVVATGTLLVEHKVIHECGRVGHIEDIAVSEQEQGRKLGQHMIGELTRIAQQQGCYKVLLDCAPKNVAFYEKCGYKDAGVSMRIDTMH